MVLAGLTAGIYNFAASRLLHQRQQLQKQQRLLAEEREKKAIEAVISLASLAQGLLSSDVASFFDSPCDLVNLAAVSRSVNEELALATHPKWEEMFARRWHVFHESMTHMGATDWRRIYKLTVEGQCACLLEVLHRQKHKAFALCAQPAWVRWDAKVACYMAKYVSAQPTEPERILVEEAWRLRFCPVEVRGELRPGKMPTQAEQTGDSTRILPYPYRVLTSVDDNLRVGSGVEVQFKMQKDSPFGWWYGRLDSLHESEETGQRLFSATIAFDQFPEDSCWSQMNVEFGDGRLRSNDLGGFVGGIRPCTEQEQKTWESLFPLAVAPSRQKA